MSYEVGCVSRVTLNFTDIAGVAVDPATVTITVTPPTGACVVYTLAGGGVVNDTAAVGRFYCDHAITQVGVHIAKGVSTGPSAGVSTIFTSIA